MKVVQVLGIVVATMAITSLGVAALDKGPDQGKGIEGRDAAIEGRVIDLHSFMTGKFSSDDRAKAVQLCIRAGVPVALETPQGLVLLSQADKGAARLFTPLAFQQVEVKGKLYEHHGLRYIDAASARLVKETPDDQGENEDWEEDEAEDPAPPEPAE